jgi:hypothetical protein
MKVTDSVESAGSPSKKSEDRLGYAGNIAWVVDGASDFSEASNLPGLSDVHWLVDKVQDGLTEYGSAGVDLSARQLVDLLASDVRQELNTHDLSTMRNYPVCSIGLVIEHADHVEIARIGDATVVASRESGIVELGTSFFDAREAAAVREAKKSAAGRERTLGAIFTRRLEYISGVHGESVFSGHPHAVLNVHSETIDRKSGDLTFLACTDGFSRAVNEYGLFGDWESLLIQSDTHSLTNIVAAIREHEVTNYAITSNIKFKAADDIAAIKTHVT